MKLSLQFKNVFAFVLCLNFLSFSQQIKDPISNPSNFNEKCGFTEKHQQLLQNDPTYSLKRQQEEIHIENFARNPLVEKVVLTIPVVIHIIHKGETIGSGTNISTAQIQSAIDNLNTAYSNGVPYNGVNTDIQFCLAQRDPSGNPHSGINRINGTSLSGYSTGGIGTGGATETSVKALSVWDNTRYYNFWIVSEIDNNDGGAGTQGYAYFPGAGPTVDGAVMLYNAFGYDPNGALGYNLKSYTNRNATPIHEVGHALNLYHTFEGDGSGSTCPAAGNLCGSNVGDCVADTPPHKRSNSDCLINTIDATCNSVDRDLYVHNFMDYSSDLCQSQFTANQATRMTSSLTSGGLRASLTSSNGCNPVFANDVSVSNIVAPSGTYCFTTFSPQVSLKNIGTSILTSATITYNIDAGANQVFSWTGNLSSGSTEIVTLNSITTTTGTHTFNATSTLPNGLSDQYTPNNLASQTFTITSSLPLPFVENFEATFPPTNWTNTSEDGAANDTWDVNGYKIWEKRTTAGNNGSTFSAGINNFNNAYVSSISSSDALITPSIDLQSASAPSLTFKVAHKNYPGYSDSLRVLISTDCGINFTPIYTKSGAALATNGSLTTSFSPTLVGDWRTETIDLTAFAGNIIKLQFESINQYGNNIFIDNINLIDNCSAPVVTNQSSNFSSCTTSNTSFFVTNSGGGTYQWQENNGSGFVNISNGGVYSNATTATLNLNGLTIGMNSYQYRCVVTNACGFVNSIPVTLTVNQTPAIPAITISSDDLDNTICPGTTINFTSSITGGGTLPSYQWKLNGSFLTTGANYSHSTFVSGDVITCHLTSSAACVNPSLVNSNPITITVIPNPTITAGTFNNPTSCSSLTGSIQISGSGSGNLSWSGTSSGNMNSVTLPTTISNLGAGTYNMTFNNGCVSNTISQTLTDPGTPSIPTISASGSTNICSGSSVTLTASTSNGILWSNGQTSQSITVSTAGNYSVTTTVLGCSSSSTVTTINTIPQPATPTITPGSATTFCSGGNVVLSSSASNGNVWSTGETTQSITVNSQGNYSVASTINSCTSSLSSVITVTVNPNPIISVGTFNNPTSCSSLTGSIQISGTGAGNLSWSGTSSGNMNGVTFPLAISNLGAGTYNITFNNGCVSNTIFQTLTDPEIPVIPTITANGSTNICFGSSVTLTASTSNGILWSNGQTAQSIIVSTEGNYSVTTTVLGCSSSSIATTINTIPLPITPTISAGSATTFCSGGNVVLTSAAASGNNWSTGETTQSITVNTSGNYFVTEITGGCASPISSVITITVTNSPSISLGSSINPSTCQALDGSIEILGAGSGNLTWNGTVSGSINGINLPTNVNSLGAGFYNFTFSNGCNSNLISASIVDPILQIPTISANGPTNICLGDVIALTSSTISGNTWTTGETAQTINVSAAGFYSVTVNNLNCSATSLPIEVTLNSLPATPTISASGPLTYCEGESVNLTSSAAIGNNWSTGETTQTITVSTTETITVSNGTGNCQATSLPVTTIMNLNPTVSLDPFNAICNTAGLFPLTGGLPAGGMYSLNGTNITDFNPATGSIGPNNIIYSITDMNSCVGTTTQILSVNDCSGIQPNSKSLFSIFPNPTKASLYLKGNDTVEILSAELRDELGRVVLNVNEISNSTEIDLTPLSNGIYTLLIKGNNFTEIQKVQLLK